MSAQEYLHEFLDVTIKLISQQVERKNVLPRPQVAFLKDSKIQSERICIDNEKAISLSGVGPNAVNLSPSALMWKLRSSFRRKPKPSLFKLFYTPIFAGVTV